MSTHGQGNSMRALQDTCREEGGRGGGGRGGGAEGACLGVEAARAAAGRATHASFSSDSDSSVKEGGWVPHCPSGYLSHDSVRAM